MTKTRTEKALRLAGAGLAAGIAAGAVGARRAQKQRRLVNATQELNALRMERMLGDRLRMGYVKGEIPRDEYLARAAGNRVKYGLGYRKLVGRGAYGFNEAGGDIITGIGAGLGSLALGPAGPVGAAVGSTIGGGIGREIANISGFGKYTVGQNSISTVGDIVPEGYEVPTFGSGSGGTRITHREYVKDIVVPTIPTAFDNTSYTINPGNPLLFPWLATIASQYQQYEFLGCVFTFKTLSSDITGGGALGAVVLATNYDVLEAPFSSKITMENTQYTVSAKPSQSQIHCLECDPSQRVTKLQYIRGVNSGNTVSQDARFYDMGNFQVATQGLPGLPGTVLGELWVTYDIMLHKPEVSTITTPTQSLTAIAPSVSNPIGTSLVTTGANIVVGAGLNGIRFASPGTYLVVTIKQGTALRGIAYGGTVTRGVGNGAFPVGVATTYNQFLVVTVTQPSQTLIMDCTADGTLTSFTVQLTALSPSIWVTG